MTLTLDASVRSLVLLALFMKAAEVAHSESGVGANRLR